MIGVGSALVSLLLIFVCYSLTLTAKRADERTWCRNGNRSSDLTRLPGVFQPGNLVTYP